MEKEETVNYPGLKAGASIKSSMLTRESMREMAIVENTTLIGRQKNDRGMLPQSHALEDCVADTLRGTTRNAHSQTASVQHSRGEPDGNAKPSASPVKAESSVEAERGVSRTYIHSPLPIPLVPEQASNLVGHEQHFSAASTGELE